MKQFLLILPIFFLFITNSYSYINSIGVEFKLIKAGSFIMGSDKNERNRLKNETEHKVTISKDFYISKTEITQRQWGKIMATNPAFFKKYGKEYPIESVSWFDVQEFIKKLNEKEKTNKYRLPTEAEWEYVARAGSLFPFPFGTIAKSGCSFDKDLDIVAWYCGNSKRKKYKKSWEISQKKQNAWGIYDMQGNVAEWCLDSCRDRNYWTGFVGAITNTYKDNITNPLSTKGDKRIVRGGSWSSSIQNLRFAKRDFRSPKAKKNTIGFRLLKEK